MLTVATHGPDEPNQAILPFAALKGSIGAAGDGNHPEERPEMFLMQEAVYLASSDTDLNEIKGVGLPPVADVMAFLEDHGFRMITCRPCAEGRGLESNEQLIDCAEMGDGSDLAALTQQHEEVLTF